MYLPVRRFCPKYVALMTTFVVSGLFHEWLVWLSFAPMADTAPRDRMTCRDGSCFQPTYGPATVFFLYQGGLIAVEFVLGKYLNGVTQAIPTQLATLIVICMGGSLAHWFSDGYIHSSFFLDAQVAFVVIKRVKAWPRWRGLALPTKVKIPTWKPRKHPYSRGPTLLWCGSRSLHRLGRPSQSVGHEFSFLQAGAPLKIHDMAMVARSGYDDLHSIVSWQFGQLLARRDEESLKVWIAYAI